MIIRIAAAVLASMVAIVSAMAASQQEELVKRGEYLVNAVMTCSACHTPFGPNGHDMSKVFSGGGLTFDEPPFKVTASNITPDKETGIGSWTDEQLKKFLITGVRPNGTLVAPVMPTPFYVAMTNRDMSALVAYIRSVPAIHNEVPTPYYKMKMMPVKAPMVDAQMTEADQRDPLKHGRYLAALAHCLECHTPLTPTGRDPQRIGVGGVEFEGPFGKSVSANITSDKTSGLGAWTDDEIKRAISQGIARDGHKLKPPMGYAAYAQMTPQDLSSIVAFVRTLPAKK